MDEMKTIRGSLYHKVDAEDSKGEEGQEQGKRCARGFV